jgi:hypothetical protein
LSDFPAQDKKEVLIMSKLNLGTRVVVIGEDNEVKKGVITNIHDSIDMAVVHMDNGAFEKIRFCDIGIDTDAERGEDAPEENTAPVITAEAIIKTTAEVTAKLANLISYKDVLLIKKIMNDVVNTLFPIVEND